MNNKVKFGLRNVYWAELTFDEQGLPVYGKPKRYPGAIELTLEPRGELYELEADDIIYYASEVNNGYDGTFTSALLPDEFKEWALGERKDANGVTIETTNDRGKPFALLSSVQGDVRPVRTLLYNCIASRPTLGSATKGKSMEVKTEELKFVVSGLDDGTDDPKIKATTNAKTNPEAYNAWYDAVYLPTMAEVEDELPFE